MKARETTRAGPAHNTTNPRTEDGGQHMTLAPSVWELAAQHFDAPKARFLLHAGDLINRPDRDAEWGEWHRAGGWRGRLPLLPHPSPHP